MNDPKRVVARGYDRVVASYARLEGGREWPRIRWLRKVLDGLVGETAVLDLGCGSGDPACVEIAKNHKVTGVDISQKQIELARQHVPSGDFICGDVGSVNFPAGSFNAVVSFYTLEHIPREEHAAIFKRIWGWLRINGRLLISIEAEDIEGGVGEWLGVPMFFSSYDPETVKQLIVDAGFEIEETAVETQIEGETEIPYLWVLAQKLNTSGANREEEKWTQINGDKRR